jgi:chromate transporter
VERRRWIDEETFADFLALAQLLPGPGSSQICFLIGLSRAGLRGGIAAWLGFTLPSAILMTLFAAGLTRVHRELHGLQVAAVAVVAAAVVAMFRRLCPDWQRAVIAAAAAVVALVYATPLTQMLLIAAGAGAGVLLLRSNVLAASRAAALPVTRRATTIALACFAVLFMALRISGPPLVYALYRTGSLVFGGGHVVLPLLEQAIVRPGWVSNGDFLAGYGAAQAIPGPLFTFGAFLGFVARVQPNGPIGAVLGLLAIFSPGLLLAYGVAPFWGSVRDRSWARPALSGVNAAVVGLLAATLGAAARAVVHSPADAFIALAGFALLLGTRIPPVLVVLAIAASEALFL